MQDFVGKTLSNQACTVAIFWKEKRLQLQNPQSCEVEANRPGTEQCPPSDRSLPSFSIWHPQ